MGVPIKLKIRKQKRSLNVLGGGMLFKGNHQLVHWKWTKSLSTARRFSPGRASWRSSTSGRRRWRGGGGSWRPGWSGWRAGGTGWPRSPVRPSTPKWGSRRWISKLENFSFYFIKKYSQSFHAEVHQYKTRIEDFSSLTQVSQVSILVMKLYDNFVWWLKLAVFI